MNKNSEGQRAHELFAPSDSSRWSTCYGAMALELELFGDLGAKEGGPNEFADEGTDAHTLASDYFAWKEASNDARATSVYYFGAAVGRPLPKGSVVDKSMARHVRQYIDSVEQYLSAANSVWHACERRVTVSDGAGKFLTAGTADFIILTDDGEELQIHDLKYGAGVEVFAENNRQLLLYAMGALAELSEEIRKKVKRIRIVIHQPRIKSGPDEWVCSVEYLQALRRGLAAAVERNITLIANTKDWLGTDKVFDNLIPSGKTCQWCAVKAYCPALIKTADIAANAGLPFYHPLPDPGAALAANLQKVALIRKWCKAIEDEALVLAQQGKLPGYKVVEGRKGDRKWTSEQEVEHLLRKFGLPAADTHTRPTLLSPSQLEKQVDLSSAVWEMLSANISRAQGKATLAEVGDRRPAISTTADAFDDLSAPEHSGIRDLL